MKKTCLSAAIALAMMGVASAHATLANGQPYSVSMDAKGFMIDGQYLYVMERRHFMCNGLSW